MLMTANVGVNTFVTGLVFSMRSPVCNTHTHLECYTVAVPLHWIHTV